MLSGSIHRARSDHQGLFSIGPGHCAISIMESAFRFDSLQFTILQFINVIKRASHVIGQDEASRQLCETCETCESMSKVVSAYSLVI